MLKGTYVLHLILYECCGFNGLIVVAVVVVKEVIVEIGKNTFNFLFLIRS